MSLQDVVAFLKWEKVMCIIGGFTVRHFSLNLFCFHTRFLHIKYKHVTWRLVSDGWRYSFFNPSPSPAAHSKTRSRTTPSWSLSSLMLSSTRICPGLMRKAARRRWGRPRLRTHLRSRASSALLPTSTSPTPWPLWQPRSTQQVRTQHALKLYPYITIYPRFNLNVTLNPVRLAWTWTRHSHALFSYSTIINK